MTGIHPFQQSGRGEGLTERDFITIGLCAGFLVLLYIFGMVVLIIMKKKQRRDARLREQVPHSSSNRSFYFVMQFLNLPLPNGLGYKSSRILGLEQQLEKNKAGLNDEVRYSTKSKSFSKLEPKITKDLIAMQTGMTNKMEEKIYDITKVIVTKHHHFVKSEPSGSFNTAIFRSIRKHIILHLSILSTINLSVEKQITDEKISVSQIFAEWELWV